MKYVKVTCTHCGNTHTVKENTDLNYAKCSFCGKEGELRIIDKLTK